MATAKPKTKRMMTGGAASGETSTGGARKLPISPSRQALLNRPNPMPPRKKPPIIYGGPDALQARIARMGAPNPKVMQGNLNARDFRNATMKKGGAVKKAIKK